MSVSCEERLAPSPGRLWILGFVKTKVPDADGEYEVYVWKEGPSNAVQSIFITNNQFEVGYVNVITKHAALELVPRLKSSLREPYCYKETPGTVHASSVASTHSAWVDINVLKAGVESAKEAVAIVRRQWPKQARPPEERKGEEVQEEGEEAGEEGGGEEAKEEEGEEEAEGSDVEVLERPVATSSVAPTKEEAKLLKKLGLDGASLLVTKPGPTSGLEAVRYVAPSETDDQMKATAAFFASTRLSQLADDPEFQASVAAHGHLVVEDVCKTVGSEAYALQPDDVRALLWLSGISTIILDTAGAFIGSPENPLTRRAMQRLRRNPASKVAVILLNAGHYRVVSKGGSPVLPRVPKKLLDSLPRFETRVEKVKDLPCEVAALPETQYWFQVTDSERTSAMGFQLVEASEDHKWWSSTRAVAINGLCSMIEAKEFRTLLAEFLYLMAFEARIVLAVVPFSATLMLWDCGFVFGPEATSTSDKQQGVVSLLRTYGPELEENVEHLNFVFAALQDAHALHGLWPDNLLFQPLLPVMKATLAQGVVMARTVSCPRPNAKLPHVRVVWEQNQKELKELLEVYSF